MISRTFAIAAGVKITGVVGAGVAAGPFTTSAGVLVTDAVAIVAISWSELSFSVLPCTCSNKRFDVPGVVRGAKSLFSRSF
jgi:hypothetical protein